MDDSPVHLKADLSEAERELTREVRDLERRVSNLEQRVGKGVSVPDAAPTRDPGVLPALPMFAEAVPIFGIALLGIAGAYLLRAMTELGVFPRPVGVAAGIVYAVVWLWLAARVPAGRGFAPVVNGLTSAVILAPLLWEATIRFHTMPSRTTAAVVAAFSLAGQALSWRKRLTILSGIASASAALIAAVLLGCHPGSAVVHAGVAGHCGRSGVVGSQRPRTGPALARRGDGRPLGALTFHSHQP